MGAVPTTRPSLLIRLRDSADHQAWQQFDDLYGPLIHQFARRKGLQNADAADFAQVVLGVIAAEIKRLDYDPKRGTFRSWLYAVVRNQLHKFNASRRQRDAASGDSDVQRLLDSQPSREDGEVQLWQREHERRLFLWAAEQVRPRVAHSSWQAFWQTAVLGKSARDMGRALGLSVGAIYTAKSRVLSQIKREIEQVRGDEDDFGRPGP